MTAARPHRPALPPDRALAELQKNSGTQFAPRVVAAFVAATSAGVQPAAVSQSALLALLRTEATTA
jgi:HD-GYP domain-containing protein (c-di-GMP phosphodiesterase class II)